eukprot:GAHX01001837.1.p1 GENE.GAHX01001837.1~~GAHX01001837.1.p1  ORF type:complete len:254 (+),score=33.63 GAHX01001837.1:225-986(+)
MFHLFIVLGTVLSSLSAVTNKGDKDSRPLVRALGNYSKHMRERALRRNKDIGAKEFAVHPQCLAIFNLFSRLELIVPNDLAPDAIAADMPNYVWRFIWSSIRAANDGKYVMQLKQQGTEGAFFFLEQYKDTDLVTPVKVDNFFVDDGEFDASMITIDATSYNSCLMSYFDPGLEAILIDIFFYYNGNSANIWFFCVEPIIQVNLSEQIPLVPGPGNGGELDVSVKFYDVCASPAVPLSVDFLPTTRLKYKVIS